MSKAQTSEQIARVRAQASEAREELAEARKTGGKFRTLAKEAVDRAKNVTKKFERLGAVVEDRESVARDLTASFAGAAIGIGVVTGWNWGVEKVGSAIPAVGRNVGYVQGISNIVVGGGAYAAERYLRQGEVPPLGSEIASTASKVAALLGAVKVGQTYWRGRQVQQDQMQRALLQAQQAQAAAAQPAATQPAATQPEPAET